jgi:hypothetical protein
MADTKSLKSYLISLGFAVNNSQLQQFNNAMKSASTSVEDHTNKWIGKFAKAYAAGVGVFAAIGTAAITAADKVAMADQKYRLWGEHMFMDVQHARELKLMTETLGATLGEIMHDPELRDRGRELLGSFGIMEKQLKTIGFERTMVQIRDVRLEIQRLGLEGQYFLMNVVAKVFKALGGQNLAAKLKTFNDYIVAHIPLWSDMFTTYITPILKDTEAVLGSVWDIFKGLALDFTNLIGLLSGNNALESTTLDFHKFAEAVKQVVHWLALLLETIDWVIQKIVSHPRIFGALAGGVAGGAGGGALGTAIGGAIGGVPGAAVGGAIGTTIGVVGGAGLGVGVGSMVENASKGGPTGADALKELATKPRFTFQNPFRGTPTKPTATGAVDKHQMALLAADAGKRLGIPAEWVYGQWAHETNDFTYGPAIARQNFGGLKTPDLKSYRVFPNAQAYEDYWVKYIARKFPAAVGAKSLHEYLTDLKQGSGGQYFEDNLAKYEADTMRRSAGYSKAAGVGSGPTINIAQVNVMQPSADLQTVLKKIKDATAQDDAMKLHMNLAEMRGW